MTVQESRPAHEDINLAHRINHLVDQGEFSPEYAFEAKESRATAGEPTIEEMERVFNEKFVQSISDPQLIRNKEYGHFAEDVILELLRNIKGVSVRHGSASQDMNEKIDLILEVNGINQPVYIQITSRHDIQEKMKGHSTKEIIPVIIPNPEDVVTARANHNRRDLLRIVREVMKQVLDGLHGNHKYWGVYNRLEQLFA